MPIAAAHKAAADQVLKFFARTLPANSSATVSRRRGSWPISTKNQAVGKWLESYSPKQVGQDMVAGQPTAVRPQETPEEAGVLIRADNIRLGKGSGGGSLRIVFLANRKADAADLISPVAASSVTRESRP